MSPLIVRTLEANIQPSWQGERAAATAVLDWMATKHAALVLPSSSPAVC